MPKSARRSSALKALRTAIKVAGSQEKLAKLLGLKQPTVGAWAFRGLPAERVLQVEQVTGISRHDLRPDLYPRPTPQPAPETSPTAEAQPTAG